jgi:hypothetical protein
MDGKKSGKSLSINVLLLHYVRCKTLPTVPSSARRHVCSAHLLTSRTQGEYTVWTEPWNPGLKFKLYEFAISTYMYFVGKFPRVTFSCMSKQTCVNLIFTILVWHDSLLEAGLKLCMCNLFDTITFMDMSNQNLSVYDIGCFKITLCELSPGKPDLKFLQVQSLMLMWISHFSG